MSKIKFNICLLIIVFINFYRIECQSCPDGWKQFNNKCFMFYSDKSFLTFYESHLICKDFFNATLVSIHTDEEQAFLTKLAFTLNKAQNHVWIGARRISTDKFIWEDNTPFDYMNWAKTQPNNLDGKHFCASLLQSPNAAEVGQWYDDPCADKYHVICQKYLTDNSQQTNGAIFMTETPITTSKQNTNTTITRITFNEFKSLYNKTLINNSSTIAALTASTRGDMKHMKHINITLTIVAVVEFLIIVSLVYIVFRKNPTPYRTLVMSECNRNQSQP